MVQEYNNQSVFWSRVGLLVIIMIPLSLIGNFILMGLAYFSGAQIADQSDIFDAIALPQFRPYIKAGIALNHIFMFSLSALVFAWFVKKKDWLSYFGWKKVNLELLGRFILLFVVSYPLIGASAMLTDLIDLPDWMQSMDHSAFDSLENLLMMDGPIDLIVNLFIIALIPAIGEELLFRGVIQEVLVKRLKNPHIAIWIASIVFGAVHLQIAGFLPKVLIGVILGYAYYLTKSIFYPMVLHFLNNGLQTVLMYVSGEDMNMESMPTSEDFGPQLWFVAVFSAILSYIIFKNIIHYIQNSKAPQV